MRGLTKSFPWLCDERYSASRDECGTAPRRFDSVPTRAIDKIVAEIDKERDDLLEYREKVKRWKSFK